MRMECRERFPHQRLQRKPLVNDPDMHHGTQFYVSCKRPMPGSFRCTIVILTVLHYTPSLILCHACTKMQCWCLNQFRITHVTRAGDPQTRMVDTGRCVRDSRILLVETLQEGHVVCKDDTSYLIDMNMCHMISPMAFRQTTSKKIKLFAQNPFPSWYCH